MRSLRLILYALLLVACGYRIETAYVQERSLLGIKLRAEMRAWLDDIERVSGKEIYAERAPLGDDDGGDGFVGGENYIAERGTAILRVNIALDPRDTKRQESIIAHELLHLRQRVRGYPVFEIDDAASSKNARMYVDARVIGDILEGIEHYMFAPEMRQLGLDTVADMIGGLSRARRQGVSTDDPLKTLYYFRASLEYKDPAQFEELRRAYRANGWTRSIRRGETLAAIVRRANLRTPADVTPTFLRCIGELYGGAFKFTARTAPPRVPRDHIHPTMLVKVITAKPSPARRGE